MNPSFHSSGVSDTTLRTLPTLSRSEEFFEWKPKFISFIRAAYPGLAKWLPPKGDEPYPDPNQPPFPINPGDAIPNECLFTPDDNAGKREYAKQQLDIYHNNLKRYEAFQSAKVGCTETIMAAVKGDVAQRVFNDAAFNQHGINSNFQGLWVCIVNSTKLTGKSLRDEQDRVMDRLRFQHQRIDEDVQSFTCRFDTTLRYAKEIGLNIAEEKKIDLFLSNLNTNFNAFRNNSYLSDRYNLGNTLELMKIEASKWETDLMRRIHDEEKTNAMDRDNKDKIKGYYHAQAAVMVKGDVEAEECEEIKVMVTQQTDSNGIPDWITNQLSREEYNKLTPEQKRIKSLVRQGERTSKFKPRCKYCKKTGHEVNNCHELDKLIEEKNVRSTNNTNE